MTDVMLDLETLGTAPGCVILSIGAVAFYPRQQKLGKEFYVVVNQASCESYGLSVTPETQAWWARQSERARSVLMLAQNGLGVDLQDALDQFTAYLSGLESPVRVWGNGSDFDQPILAAAYAACGEDVPWKFWDNRCYRTLKSIVPGPPLKREGTYHNALDDAKSQALHAMKLL